MAGVAVSGGAPKRRSTLAVYISRRTRKEWLTHDALTLAALAVELPGKRLACRVGSWRGKPRQAEGAAASSGTNGAAQ